MVVRPWTAIARIHRITWTETNRRVTADHDGCTVLNRRHLRQVDWLPNLKPQHEVDVLQSNVTSIVVDIKWCS